MSFFWAKTFKIVIIHLSLHVEQPILHPTFTLRNTLVRQILANNRSFIKFYFLQFFLLYGIVAVNHYFLHDNVKVSSTNVCWCLLYMQTPINYMYKQSDQL